MSHDKFSSLIYKGKTVKEWSQINKIPMSAIYYRIKKLNWTLERTLTTPPKRVIV